MWTRSDWKTPTTILALVTWNKKLMGATACSLVVTDRRAAQVFGSLFFLGGGTQWQSFRPLRRHAYIQSFLCTKITLPLPPHPPPSPFTLGRLSRLSDPQCWGRSWGGKRRSRGRCSQSCSHSPSNTKKPNTINGTDRGKWNMSYWDGDILG